MHPTKLCCILPRCTKLSYTHPLRAMLHLSETTFFWALLQPSVPRWTLLSYYAETNLDPFELCCINLSYYDPSWLRYIIPSKAELNCTLLNYVYTAPSKLRCTLTELPPFIQYFRMQEYRTFQHPVSPVPKWKEVPMPEPVRYRNNEFHSVTEKIMPECQQTTRPSLFLSFKFIIVSK